MTTLYLARYLFLGVLLLVIAYFIYSNVSPKR
jgi:uncharacterized membrane protein YjfL (UPF0719 family)